MTFGKFIIGFGCMLLIAGYISMYDASQLVAIKEKFEKEIDLLKPEKNMDLRKFTTLPTYVYQIPKQKSLAIGNVTYIIEKVDCNYYKLYSSESYILYVKFEPVKNSSASENLN